MKRLPIRTLLVLGLICAIGFGSGIFQDLIAIYRTKIETTRVQAEIEASRKKSEAAFQQGIDNIANSKAPLSPGDTK